MPPMRQRQRQSGLLDWFVGIGLAIVVAGAVIGTAWFGDDALITFQQVRLFVAGDGMIWNPGIRVQAFTHPAWFFVLSLGHWITGALYWPTTVISTACTVGAVLLLWDFVRHQPGFAGRRTLPALFALLVLMAPGFISFASSGLETSFSYLLAAATIRAVWERAAGVGAWLLLALLVLNRQDHALLFGPLALLLAGRAWREGRVMAMLPGCLLLVAWFGFATIYFGSPMPNTYFAKLGGGVAFEERIVRGGLYFMDAALRESFALVVIGLGIVAGAASGRMGRMFAIGLVLHLIYLMWIGGDFMRGRFLAVPFLVSMFLIAGAIRPRTASLPALAVIILAVALGKVPQIRPDYSDNEAHFGIVNERGWYYPLYGLLSPGRHWFAPSPGTMAGARPVKAIIGCGQIGAHRLVSPPRVHVVDICGLTDPFIARLPAPDVPDWRVGHQPRRLPLNYDQVVMGRAKRLTGGHGQELFDEMTLIARGPLFDSRRLGAIWRRLIGAGAVAPEEYRIGGTGDLFLDDGTGPKPYSEALASRTDTSPQE